jgi:ABC-type branched-subunit amino acid transport system substrate-binding protein
VVSAVTILVLIPDGQTSSFAFNNALKVITASNANFLMVGASSLYSTEVLQILKPELASRFTQQVAWHNLSSPNTMFPAAANKFWGGEVNWRTALVYDATITLITALQSLPQANRIDVKNALNDPKFQASGATGVISFASDRERKEQVVELVKVVPSKCSPYGFRFVPVNYPTAQLESLEFCAKEK